jgi:hypothetical protein
LFPRPPLYLQKGRVCLYARVRNHGRVPFRSIRICLANCGGTSRGELCARSSKDYTIVLWLEVKSRSTATRPFTWAGRNNATFDKWRWRSNRSEHEKAWIRRDRLNSGRGEMTFIVVHTDNTYVRLTYKHRKDGRTGTPKRNRSLRSLPFPCSDVRETLLAKIRHGA